MLRIIGNFHWHEAKLRVAWCKHRIIRRPHRSDLFHCASNFALVRHHVAIFCIDSYDISESRRRNIKFFPFAQLINGRWNLQSVTKSGRREKFAIKCTASCGAAYVRVCRQKVLSIVFDFSLVCITLAFSWSPNSTEIVNYRHLTFKHRAANFFLLANKQEIAAINKN